MEGKTLHTRAWSAPFLFSRRRAVKPRAERPSDNAGKTAINEEVLQRLRAAEAEAAALRQELAAARAATEQQDAGQKEQSAETIQEVARRIRIDGAGMRREGMLSGLDRGDWLNEADRVALDTIGGEASDISEGAVVQRRLALGLAATALLGGFALVPTDYLRLQRPSKPLFLYLVPLLRVQSQLKDVEDIVSDGNWTALESALQRIQGPPNNANANLRDAAGSLQSVQDRERAKVLARNVIEDLDAIDYNKYFAAVGKPGARGGSQERLFVDFSIRALRSAQARLHEFFRLMPKDAVEAAEQQLSQMSFS